MIKHLLALVVIFGIAGCNDSRADRDRADMERIAQAIRRYVDDHGEMPPLFTMNAAGQRLHSWRTYLLPYLGRKDVFDRIDLSVPWNEGGNVEISRMILAEYECELTDASGEPLHYVAMSGLKTFWRDRILVEIDQRQDAQYCITVVNCRCRRESWMEPVDYEYETRDDVEAIVQKAFANLKQPFMAIAGVRKAGVIFVDNKIRAQSLMDMLEGR